MELLLTVIQCLALVCFVYIAYLDWQYKAVPLWSIIIAGGLSVVAGYPQLFEITWWCLVVVILGVLALFAYVYQRQHQQLPLGLADWLLLPIMLLWFPADKAPLYLIIVGILGVLLAYIWRWLYHETVYPFTPCLIIAWVLMILT